MPYDSTLIADASIGLIAFALIGAALVVAGVALIRDWRRLGTGSASLLAMFSYTRGRRAFARDWNRRDQFRRWQGGWLILLGSVMAAVALRSLLG